MAQIQQQKQQQDARTSVKSMSFIADTSVWIDHLKKEIEPFKLKLEELEVFTHSLVIIELSLGQIKNREEIIGFLEYLPKAKETTNSETLHLIKHHKLHGIGIGATDAHILASAKISGLSIFTRDVAMSRAMKLLKIQLFKP